MSDFDLKEILLEELDYKQSSGLRSTDLWPNGRPIEDIDSAYFVQNVPVAYFSKLLPDDDPQRIYELYKKVWNQSKVPLVYVILHNEIRIYNGYAEPPKTPEDLEQSDRNRLLKNLQQLIDDETARKKFEDQLGDYKRLNLETGAFWNSPDGQRITRKTRADQQLLKAMNAVRFRLIYPKDETLALSSNQAYALLGRSIFIRYLEDRGILTPEVITAFTDGRAKKYREALNNLNTTNQLFEGLSQRFNGDMFPADKEREILKKDHLDLIARFLEGYDFDADQPSFWPYDFKYIPIELISGIYDTFLTGEKRKELGAYYTPLALVDFVVEATLPLEKTHLDMTILDPACGSGVFLVRTFQRLIEAWQRDHRGQDERISVQRLKEILLNCIFGVDIEANAVQIAAFSLYLSMLDYLTNEDIEQEDFRFPSMKNNLIQSDFFSKAVEENYLNRKFDRIVGNLPWGESTLTKDASERVVEYKYVVGDNQIVQAFLQHIPKFCADNGEIALIAGTRTTILVGSTHELFRRQFFEQYHVRAVVNFSALRRELFIDSINPSVALFYQNLQPAWNSKVVYGVPKPSSLSQHLGAIVLDTTEVKYLDREELLMYPNLWKIAAWGTTRDAALIQRLLSYPKLLQLEEDGLLREKISVGFIVGNRKQEALWLYNKPFLNVKKLKQDIVKVRETVQEDHFERPRNEGIYTTPLALIRRSSCEAAFFNSGFVAYRDQITGVAAQAGNEYILKWLVAYINTPLARYYHFLTSSRWAVERTAALHEEYKRMPFFIPDKSDVRLQEVLERFDQIAALYNSKDALIDHHSIEEHKAHINKLVFDLYSISPIEEQLIHDMLNYGITFFEWIESKNRAFTDDKSKPVKPPDGQMLQEYAKVFAETVRALMHYQNQTLNATVYHNGMPLSVVQFKVVNLADEQPVQIINQSKELQDKLRDLDKLLLKQHTPTLYTRKHVRIYDGSYLYMIRPSERRFWTQSQARVDADSFIAEMLSQSKKEMGVAD